MSDTTIRTKQATGSTFYVQVENSAGLIYNGTTYASFANANWSIYSIAMTESPTGSGRYSCSFPSTSVAGYYTWTVYRQAGGSPAISDPPFAYSDGSQYWDGTTFGNSPPATLDLTATLPVGSQDAVTAPTIGDALLGAWTEAFAQEQVDPATNAYTKRLPDDSGNVRSFVLTTDSAAMLPSGAMREYPTFDGRPGTAANHYAGTRRILARRRR